MNFTDSLDSVIDSSSELAEFGTDFQVAVLFTVVCFIATLSATVLVITGSIEHLKNAFCCSLIGFCCLRCGTLFCGCCKPCARGIARRASIIMERIGSVDSDDQDNDLGENWLEIPAMTPMQKMVEDSEFPPVPNQNHAKTVPLLKGKGEDDTAVFQVSEKGDSKLD